MANEKKPLRSSTEDWQRALEVVAHPDDLEYGAASADARRAAQGKEIEYLILSLKVHRVYIEHLGDFDPDRFLRENAAWVGKRSGSRYAVGFEVIDI